EFDGRLLSQAFGNIVKNAAEAVEAMAHRTGEPGIIRIVARREAEAIVVDVMDNGVGLPKQNRQRLLEPYVTHREKGTGLGLAIVRKIIEDHGGSLELRDAPGSFHGGRGALIRVRLPLTAAPASAAPPSNTTGQVGSLERRHAPGSLRGGRAALIRVPLPLTAAPASAEPQSNTTGKVANGV